MKSISYNDIVSMSEIVHKLDKLNRLKQWELELKERELKQQMFFIELIEEVLSLDDVQKRSIHQRTMGY